MESVECGAVALSIILAYYGRYIPLEELRAQCGVNRDGSSAAKIIKAAQHNGMEARGIQISADSLSKKKGLPIIVFWQANHFVVVEGFTKKHVWINDPGYGRIKITSEEFKQNFSEVAIELAPGPDFVKQGKPGDIISGLKNRFSGSLGPFILIVAISVVMTFPMLTLPVFTRVFIDDIIAGGQTDWALTVALSMLGAAMLGAFFGWLQQYSILKLHTKLTLGFSSRFFWHLLRLPASFFTQRYAPEITQRCRLNEVIAQLLSGSFASGILNLIMSIIYLAFLFFYDPLLVCVPVTAILVNLIFIRFIARQRRDTLQRVTQEQGKAQAIAMGTIQSIETIKSQGGESDAFSIWSGFHAKSITQQQKLGVISSWGSFAPIGISSMTSVAILGFGAFRVMDGVMTIGVLAAFQMLTQMLMAPVNNIVMLLNNLQDAAAFIARIEDVEKNPPERETADIIVNDDDILLYNKVLSGELELKDITFGYSPLDEPFIKNFSLKVAPSRITAIVGDSGSGKSTISKIAAGIYIPWSGNVLLDGVFRSEIKEFVIRNNVGIVDQNIHLFEGTFRDNLTLWNSTISEEDIICACQDSCIDSLIFSQPMGLDEPLLERGSNLSGGERQRLEIARALVRNPNLLILDEATNALDPVTEAKIEFNLRKRGCSMLVVAHRLSTIRDADEIIVMEKGNIVERGNHKELMELKGKYCKLVETKE
ncbi:MAG: NHLP family bacteriocin export ABC transporter peptidase/permease/ATPase subunit [Desulfobacterales bacterium]|nr:NHLP family bacteriocin export ABC transporter peptidase/permease/ATPase subunit [Desulfobacterales bacterium]